EGAFVEAVLVSGDEAEPNLDRNRAEHGDDAQRAEWRVAGEAPTRPVAKEGPHGPRASNEIGKARGRAAEKPPQQAKYQQGQDADARPDVPIGIAESCRPPAERDQRGEQPMKQPRRQVP